MQSDGESSGPKSSSSNRPVTCNITSYSMTDISSSITSTVFSGLLNNAGDLNIIQSSIIYGGMTYFLQVYQLYILLFHVVGGFCEANSTNSSLYGSNQWPKTGGGSGRSTFCRYGHYLNWDDDDGGATVRRYCRPGGVWSSPDYTLCRDSELLYVYTACILYHDPLCTARPYVRILRQPHSVDYNGTYKEGERVSLLCQARSALVEGDTVTWYDPKGAGEFIRLYIVNYCHCFPFSAVVRNESSLFNGSSFSEGITISDFKQLIQYSVSFLGSLSTYHNSELRQSISPSRSIEGTYVCEGRNSYGSRSISVTININGN